MNKRIGISASLIAMLTVPAFAASQETGRGLLFQFDVGTGFPFYPS